MFHGEQGKYRKTDMQVRKQSNRRKEKVRRIEAWNIRKDVRLSRRNGNRRYKGISGIGE